MLGVGPPRFMSDDMLPLEFSGNLDNTEIRRVRRLAVPRFVYLLLPFLALDFSLDLWSLVRYSHVDLLDLGLSSALLLIFSARILSTGPFCPTQLKSISGPVSGHVTDDGLVWRCGARTSTLPWWHFVGWRRSGGALLLIGTPTEPVFLTKHLMKNEHDWQMFQELVGAKVNRSWVAALLY